MAIRYGSFRRPADVLSFGVARQLIFVDPDARLVLVHAAVRTIPVDLGAELALWRGVVRELGR
jgi:hypothetical protein